MNCHTALAAVLTAGRPPMPETRVDAVGQPLTVGDTVWAIVGTSGAASRVQRVGINQVVVRRDDGMVAVLRPTSVVVLKSHQHQKLEGG
jgi:hypothetical protein